MITIRKAEVKDVNAIFGLWKNFVKEHDLMILKKSPEMKPLLTLKKNKAEMYKKEVKKSIASKNRIIFIAEKGKKPAGYIELCIDKRGYGVIGYMGVIYDIFVKKEFRKLGVSSRLKQEAVKWFKSKKLRYMGLNVHIYNKQAYSVYKRWGFSDTDRRMIKKI
jgi:hypothetical protein